MGRNGTQTVEEIKVRLIHSTREREREMRTPKRNCVTENSTRSLRVKHD